MKQVLWMTMVVVAVIGIGTTLHGAPGKTTTEGETEILNSQTRGGLGQQRFNVFLKDTVELRRQLADKRAQKGELLLAVNPDKAAIDVLSEEIYQLITTIQEKARTARVGFGPRYGTAACCL